MAAANDYSTLVIVDVQKRESLPSPFYTDTIKYTDHYVRLAPTKYYVVTVTRMPGLAPSRAYFAYDWVAGRRGRFIPRGDHLLRAALDRVIDEHTTRNGA